MSQSECGCRHPECKECFPRDAHALPCPLAYPASTHLPERCTCAEVRMAERRLAHVGEGCWCAGPCPETLRQMEARVTQRPPAPSADELRAATERIHAEARRPTAYVVGRCACGAEHTHPLTHECGPVDPVAPGPSCGDVEGYVVAQGHAPTILGLPVHPDDPVPMGCVDVEKRDGSRVRFDLSGVAASRVVASAFDTVRAEAERHGFDADWVEGLENLRDAVARAPAVR
jgi:hypothetical protein